MHEGVNDYVALTPTDKTELVETLRAEGNDLLADALDSRSITELPPYVGRVIVDRLSGVAERGDQPKAQRLYKSLSQIVGLGY